MEVSGQHQALTDLHLGKNTAFIEQEASRAAAPIENELKQDRQGTVRAM
jgi:hypothetical protein